MGGANVAVAMDIDRGACDCRDCRRYHHKSIPTHPDCLGDLDLRPRYAGRQDYPLLVSTPSPVTVG